MTIHPLHKEEPVLYAFACVGYVFSSSLVGIWRIYHNARKLHTLPSKKDYDHLVHAFSLEYKIFNQKDQMKTLHDFMNREDHVIFRIKQIFIGIFEILCPLVSPLTMIVVHLRYQRPADKRGIPNPHDLQFDHNFLGMDEIDEYDRFQKEMTGFLEITLGVECEQSDCRYVTSGQQVPPAT